MTSTALADRICPAPSPEAQDASRFEAVDCYHCGANHAVPFITAEDDLTGRPGRFTFVRCRHCGLVYQSPRLTLDRIKPYYDGEYLAHRKRTDWGLLSPLFAAAMNSVDREKLRIVTRYVRLGSGSSVLDVGCGAGTFLGRTRVRYGCQVVGVDFVDLADRPALRGVEFHCGLFYEQDIGRERFDLITMWHFLEHDYDPLRSLSHARDALARDGHLVVEVPRLDSVTFRLFGDRWPGLQAPQHTVLYDREALFKMMRRAGFEVVDYLPYGAFPPYFYVFCGVAFKLLKGRGLNFGAAIYPYFAGQLVLLPVLPFIKRLNLAMQTVICRRTT
jgi:SAM-dependent methyltransferase